MKKLLVLLVIAGVAFSCTQKESNQTDEVTEGEVTEASIIPQMEVALFDTDAGNYVDKEVVVSGIVDHVCKHGGKKLKLVKDGDKSIHVESEERFDEELVGSEITLNGIVREMRVDEAYCLQMEEDNIAKHKEGETNDEDFTHKQEQIKAYRDSMAVAQTDHLSFYTLEFVSLEKQEEAQVEEGE
ncbi:MAG: hypothetical protein ABFS32_16530 [Bacteroidota bacterium]